jgi:hypothetical protein
LGGGKYKCFKPQNNLFSCKIVIFIDSALNGNDCLKYLHLKRLGGICSSQILQHNTGKAHKVVKKCTQKQTNQKDKAIKHKVPAVTLFGTKK